ncbi:MAG: hypothetical protein J1F23_06485 [Oscillospiraceae bacterium]|nr:hypothetical protein [Oscillospiraceae bacterium]
MIGLGKWTGDIDTSFAKGTAIVDVTESGGKYAFKVSVPGAANLPDFSVFDIKESGNNLSGKARVEIMGGITVDVAVTFHGDTFDGSLKVPFLGSIPIKNGRRIG